MMQLETVHSACGWCDARPQRTLTIPPDIERWWYERTLVEPNEELLALFNAVEIDDGWRIERIWLPRQRVSAVECEVLESSGDANGMIHSHHSMSAKMSGQDRRALMPSYAVSIVTNHAQEVQAFERVALPCGGIGFAELEVVLQRTDPVSDEARAEVYAVVVEPTPPVVESRIIEHETWNDLVDDDTIWTDGESTIDGVARRPWWSRR